MGRRHVALAALGLSLSWVIGCSGASPRTGQSGQLVAVLAGSTAEDFPPGERVVITWVFRTEDCLTCQAFPTEIRRVVEGYGGSIRFVAIHVGEPDDTAVAQAFFRRERLDPRYVRMSPAGYRAAFGALPLPAIYVVVNGRLIQAEFGDHAGVMGNSPLSRLIENGS